MAATHLVLEQAEQFLLAKHQVFDLVEVATWLICIFVCQTADLGVISCDLSGYVMLPSQEPSPQKSLAEQL